MRGQKKKICYLLSIGFLIFIFYIPFFSNINKISPFQERVSPNLPTNQVSNQGFFNESNKEIFWFIQITDTHYPQSSNSNLNQLFNNVFNTIDPLFMINTGDLVAGGLFGLFGDINEWIQYKDLVDRNNLDTSIYIDLIGNHDVTISAINTSYIDYSLMGREYSETQFSFSKSFSFGDYAFICLDTTKDAPYATNIIDIPGLLSYNLTGYLSKDELNWYELELEKYRDFNKIFTFGHNPFNRGGYDISSETNQNGKNFIQLNEEYNVFSYICGHSHDNYIQEINGLFEIETTNFPTDGGTYRIITMDKGQISTKLATVGTWPQYVITYPPSGVFAPDDFNNEDNKIRVLAWDPNGIDLVEWSAYDTSDNQITEWSSLSIVNPNGPLWEGEWNSTLKNRDDFEIRVRISEPINPSDNPPDDTLDNHNNGFPNFGLIPLIVIGGILITLISITGIIKHRYKSKKNSGRM